MVHSCGIDQEIHLLSKSQSDVLTRSISARRTQERDAVYRTWYLRSGKALPVGQEAIQVVG